MELASRVEALEGPSREVDIDICEAVGSYPEQRFREFRTDNLGYFIAWSDCAPRYTASLDAAMTLVPEGWDIQLSTGDGINWVKVFPPGCKIEEMDDPPHVSGKTPALALVAASLRARAEQE